jgi:hypothetical protein
VWRVKNNYFAVVERHFIKEEELNQNLVELQERLQACPRSKEVKRTLVDIEPRFEVIRVMLFCQKDLEFSHYITQNP